MDIENERNSLATDELRKLGFHLHPPNQTLYKYVDVKTAVLILTNSTLKYQTCDEFNDPLDPHLGLLDIGKLLHQRSEALSSSFNQNDYVKTRMSIARQIIRKYVNKTGILCLTTSNTHTLMWSHYADKHKGICLGFKNLTFYKDGGSAFRVKYENVIKPLPFLLPIKQDDNFIAMINLLFTKAKVWEYEQEVRIAAIGREGIHPIDPGYLCEIYFGVNTPDNTVNELMNLAITKGQKLEIVGRMRLSDDKFDLDIEQINY